MQAVGSVQYFIQRMRPRRAENIIHIHPKHPRRRENSHSSSRCLPLTATMPWAVRPTDGLYFIDSKANTLPVVPDITQVTLNGVTHFGNSSTTTITGESGQC